VAEVLTRAAMPAGLRPATDDNFGGLPPAAQFVVGIVGGFGVVCVGVGLLHLNRHEAPLLLALMALSALASWARISLPLTHGGTSVSLSYIVNLGSTMLVGPWASAPVAALSGWS